MSESVSGGSDKRKTAPVPPGWRMSQAPGVVSIRHPHPLLASTGLFTEWEYSKVEEDEKSVESLEGCG